MKKLIWFLLFSPLFIAAQQTHKVAPKESLFSIGRMYDVHPRELAEYNHVSFDEGVKIGQVLKIPAHKKMAPVAETIAPAAPMKKDSVQKKADKLPTVATDKTNKTEILEPIYHKVQTKENLYQISIKYNKVPIDDLKKWNKLTSDGLKDGMDLIVGYKKAETATIIVNPIKVVEKNTPPAAPVTITKTDTPAVVVPTPKTDTPAETNKSNTIPTSTEVKDVKKADSSTVVKIKKTVTDEKKDDAGGYFASNYKQQTAAKENIVEVKGLASTFKSTSGWDDGRYYCLSNTAPAGTIIKVINADNQKFVYAKVLDTMPDLKQNEGIAIIISKAAAEQLSVTTEKFDVDLSY